MPRKHTPFILGFILVGLSALFLLFVRPGYLRREEIPPETPPREPEVSETRQEQEVTLYFTNQEYIQSGRSDLPMLIKVQRTVEFTDETLIPKVLDELRKPPADEGLSTTLHDNLEIVAAWRETGRAYVDFSSENLWGGSLQEALLVHQIVKTLTDLPGIDDVQFLVEGEKRESLMGHVATDEPLSPDHL